MLRPGDLRGRHLLTPSDLSPAEWDGLLALAAHGKRESLGRPCAGRTLVQVFLAPSLRTRVSMQVAMHQLGGLAVEVTPGGGSWALETAEGVPMLGAAAEHVKEAAGVLGQYADGIGIRAFPEGQDPQKDAAEPVVRGFAAHAGVPVVNLESATAHPMQSLADALTLRELLGETRGRPVVLTWAYHPKALPLAVPLSFLHAAAVLGCAIRVAAPRPFTLPDDRLATLRTLAETQGGGLTTTDDREDAFKGALAVYAKSWGRPGEDQKADHAVRGRYRRWIVDPAIMAHTANAWFLHCLPVRRNVVVADAVIDGPRSAVRHLAGNRLHTARAFLAAWLGTGA